MTKGIFVVAKEMSDCGDLMQQVQKGQTSLITIDLILKRGFDFQYIWTFFLTASLRLFNF